ncbi:hypothetical protein ACF1AO_30055 [Streptomyces longwoodensis]|uniref:hypothetical protein n=1 Tax=Streptomyces longwoodensis TaxID=68231 RepID=UPI0036FFEF05
MSARHAAARLAGLWPRLPVLAGSDWLVLRPRWMAEIRAMAAAADDEERAGIAGQLSALAQELSDVRALLNERDGDDEPAWADVARALSEAADPGGRFDRASHVVAETLGEYADGRRITDTLLAAGVAAALGLGADALAEPGQWQEAGPFGERPSILNGSVPRLVPWTDPLPWLTERPDEAQWVADTWQLAVGARPGVRLLLASEADGNDGDSGNGGNGWSDGTGEGGGTGRGRGRAEAAAVLSMGTGVASVLYGTQATDASEVPRWSWPLRLTVSPGTSPAAPQRQQPADATPAAPRRHEPPGTAPSPLRQELLAAAEAKAGLITPVAASGRWSRTSLLLVPLAGGGDAPRPPGGPHATAVVVVSESPELVPASGELRSLAIRHRAAVAAAAHPGPSPRRWLEVLLDRLSQDLPLDMALHGAAEECGALPPVVVADPVLLDSTRIRPVLAAAPPEVIQRSEEARVGRALRGGPGSDDTGLALEAAGDLRVAAHRARQVPARFLRADVVEPDGTTPTAGIVPYGTFHVRVLLAADPGARPGEHAFPADALPPGRAHRLTVVATDLTPEPGHGRAEAQEIELPGDGDSTRAHLRFTAGAEGTDVRIRIAVLYGSRLLQTGLLSGRVGAQDPPVFHVEAVVRARTDELDLARTHDAALLIDRTAHGLPVVTARTEAFVHHSASHDLRRTTEVLLSGLRKLISGADRFDGYASPEFAELLIQLARLGRRLRKTLFAGDWESDGLVRELRRARSISVFSAGPEAILPVELIYDRELDTAPGRSLRLCAHAPSLVDSVDNGDTANTVNAGNTRDHAGNEGGEDCAGCPERDDRATVCPFGFWGASKVIERHVRRGSADPRFALAVSPDIDRHACDLVPVCAAASARADHNDVHAWTTAAAALADEEPEAVRLAADWTGLNVLVHKLRERNTPPGAVLLFPHSEEDADGIAVLSLGEGDEVDVVDGLEFLFAGDGGPEPVVLLLGCATAGGSTLFSDASSTLLTDGAPGVVATAVPVLGRHIIPVGVRLLTELRAAAAETSGSPLGEALLRARRKLLTDGDACVLALVGFGDTDWELHANRAAMVTRAAPDDREETS